MSGRAARASRARKRQDAKQAALAAAVEDFRRTWWELRDRINGIYLIAAKTLPTGSLRWGGKLHYFDSVAPAPDNGTPTPEDA